MILPGNDAKSIAAAASCIMAGGLFGLPTETVYGLAADADNDAAVAQIFAAKGRPADHPLIVHVAGIDAVAHYASAVPDFACALMKAFWPGPLTLILPRKPGVANAAAGGNDTIALRCPSHPVAQAVLNWGQIPINFPANSENPKQLDSDPNYLVWGLAAPSANKFGRVSPTTAQHVQDELGCDLLVLDGGPCQVGIESTIIDCTRGVPVLLRPGALTPTQIEAACGLKVLSNKELINKNSQGPKASGTLESHYAPRARVRLMDAAALQAAVQERQEQIDAPTQALQQLPTGADHALPVLAVAIWARTPLVMQGAQVVTATMPNDAISAARQLFATLRALDAQGVAQIWVETPPATPDWDGVRDRLQRAAH
ncbi:MAG: translation factor Sua5 [Comamonadaceae bacterium CG1_02_60_18]|nr:MAG: translation factor Sua5 [Comamonadaceae bacterium CG1_02_60_18]PIQ50637.1 MAG: translation factor Sua5 [Comamonadaceae bacterium CG12_big_fil_rev_8_21_14_0_65_59_15]